MHTASITSLMIISLRASLIRKTGATLRTKSRSWLSGKEIGDSERLSCPNIWEYLGTYHIEGRL